MIARHSIHGTCLFAETVQTPLTCSADDSILHESLIHPALILHPHPETVLVLGGIVQSGVREVLKHFLIPNVTWADEDEKLRTEVGKDMPVEYGFEDPLQRVRIENILPSQYLRLADVTKRDFDVIIVALPAERRPVEDVAANKKIREARALLFENAQAALKPGGILAVNGGSFEPLMWEDRKLLRRFFTRVFQGSRFVPSYAGPISYLYATKSEAPPDPTTLGLEYVDAKLRRTTVGEMQAYDGTSHVHMFALPREMRSRIDAADLRARKEMADQIVVGITPDVYMHAPYEHTIPEVPLCGETLVRDFFGCAKVDLDTTALTRLIEEAVVKMHGALSFVNASVVVNAQNVTGAKGDVTMHSIVAAIEGGSINLQVWPQYKYASASATSFNSWTAAEEAMQYLFAKLDAVKSIGTSHSRGDVDRWRGPVLDHIKYAIPRWQNPKVQIRESAISGMGVFALENIVKGEHVFRGPIGPYLMRKDEIASKPRWMAESIMHFGEQSESDIFIAPSEAALDASRYTNHHCDGNLIYQDYETLVARRDIAVGEELSLDYGTLFTDAEALDINPCRCGSSICRGRVTGDDWRKAELKDRHPLHDFLPHVQKKIIAEATSSSIGAKALISRKRRASLNEL
ncbi:hypothetical protein HKX48_002407 [Thoreauomyces humboldtii]|nr:hypothetical protein HKX48_002407 [Thoreauomyces humboldtii]